MSGTNHVLSPIESEGICSCPMLKEGEGSHQAAAALLNTGIIAQEPGRDNGVAHGWQTRVPEITAGTQKTVIKNETAPPDRFADFVV